MHGYADGITYRHEAEIHKGNSKVQRVTFMNAFLFLKNIYYVSWSLKYQPDIIGFVPNQQGPTVAGCANVWRRSLTERRVRHPSPAEHFKHFNAINHRSDSLTFLFQLKWGCEITFLEFRYSNKSMFILQFLST